MSRYTKQIRRQKEIIARRDVRIDALRDRMEELEVDLKSTRDRLRQLVRVDVDQSPYDKRNLAVRVEVCVAELQSITVTNAVGRHIAEKIMHEFAEAIALMNPNYCPPWGKKIL